MTEHGWSTSLEHGQFKPGGPHNPNMGGTHHLNMGGTLRAAIDSYFNSEFSWTLTGEVEVL